MGGTFYSENPHVSNLSARDSGAGNGCANLWVPGIFWFFLWTTPVPIETPPFEGGGVGFFLAGGWKCQFYFYGREVLFR